ncbi:hypothetical protein E2562_031290 [Oryza meyeriana var. granulata]|nr:hypothetical protein E2562_031290 [Oryza meyeriana var. granulata]KAF0896974.1 hypothetical protein E2562_031290 [Oryza meyeriana var. granulata]
MDFVLVGHAWLFPSAGSFGILTECFWFNLLLLVQALLWFLCTPACSLLVTMVNSGHCNSYVSCFLMKLSGLGPSVDCFEVLHNNGVVLYQKYIMELLSGGCYCYVFQKTKAGLLCGICKHPMCCQS